MLKKFFLTALVIAIAAAAAALLFIKNKNKKDEFTLWTIQLKPVAQEVIENSIKDFEKQNPDMKVIWVDIPIAEAQKRTLAAILGGNPPDLINLNPDFSVILAQRGALDYFSADEAEKFSKNAVEMLKYDGKIFALPFYATSSVTLFNRETFSTCGFSEVPQTYEELYNISDKLKECSKIYPFAINLNENDSLAKILNKYGVNTFEDEEQIQRAVFVYEMFNNMYKKGFVSKDTLTISHREAAEKYMSNNALFVVLGSNFINMVKENAPEIYKKSDISAQLKSKEGRYDVALMNLIIPKYARHKKEAHEFAKLLTGTKAQVELAKLTNVIPVNKEALDDEYFKQCDTDLLAKARCESIKQLENSGNKDFGSKNKKEINDAINKAAETILLDSKITKEGIEKEVRVLAQKVRKLAKQ